MQVSNSLDIFKIFHYVVSCIFLVVAVWLLIRTLLGFFKHREYKTIDKYLSFAFIINLYLQLIFGLILFTNLGLTSSSKFLNTGHSITERHWPIEHIVIMLFALFVGHLGFILSYKEQSGFEKHKDFNLLHLLCIINHYFFRFNLLPVKIRLHSI